MEDKSNRRCDDFISWMKTLDPIKRVETVRDISRSIYFGGHNNGASIKKSLAMLSQTTRVMLTRLEPLEITFYKRELLKSFNPVTGKMPQQKFKQDNLERRVPRTNNLTNNYPKKNNKYSLFRMMKTIRVNHDLLKKKCFKQAKANIRFSHKRNKRDNKKHNATTEEFSALITDNFPQDIVKTDLSKEELKLKLQELIADDLSDLPPTNSNSFIYNKTDYERDQFSKHNSVDLSENFVKETNVTKKNIIKKFKNTFLVESSSAINDKIMKTKSKTNRNLKRKFDSSECNSKLEGNKIRRNSFSESEPNVGMEFYKGPNNNRISFVTYSPTVQSKDIMSSHLNNDADKENMSVVMTTVKNEENEDATICSPIKSSNPDLENCQNNSNSMNTVVTEEKIILSDVTGNSVVNREKLIESDLYQYIRTPHHRFKTETDEVNTLNEVSVCKIDKAFSIGENAIFIKSETQLTNSDCINITENNDMDQPPINSTSLNDFGPLSHGQTYFANSKSEVCNVSNQHNKTENIVHDSELNIICLSDDENDSENEECKIDGNFVNLEKAVSSKIVPHKINNNCNLEWSGMEHSPINFNSAMDTSLYTKQKSSSHGLTSLGNENGETESFYYTHEDKSTEHAQGSGVDIISLLDDEVPHVEQNEECRVNTENQLLISSRCDKKSLKQLPLTPPQELGLHKDMPCKERGNNKVNHEIDLGTENASLNSTENNTQNTIYFRFYTTIVFYFNLEVQSRISKMADILHLAIEDLLKKEEYTKRCNGENTEGLMNNQMEEDEKDFNHAIELRAYQFLPLFEDTVKHFEESSKKTLFFTLLCKLFQHPKLIDLVNRNNIIKIRDVIKMMLTTLKFHDKDILELLSWDSIEFQKKVDIINHYLVTSTEIFKTMKTAVPIRSFGEENNLEADVDSDMEVETLHQQTDITINSDQPPLNMVETNYIESMPNIYNDQTMFNIRKPNTMSVQCYSLPVPSSYEQLSTVTSTEDLSNQH